MEQSLVVFALRLNVLEKNNLEKVGFEEDVDQCWTHLDDSDVKEEYRSKNWKTNIVVNSCETVILLIRQRQYELLINSLLEFSYVFGRMLEYLVEIRVISSFPFGIP